MNTGIHHDSLSQYEIDSLLDDIRAPKIEIDTSRPTKRSKIRPCRLGQEHRLMPRMPVLDSIHERFGGFLRGVLNDHIRANCSVSMRPVRFMEYGEFFRTLALPSNLNLIQMKPLPGFALLVQDPNLVFLVVDNMFGGSGHFHLRVEGRDFTATEQGIISRMVSSMCREYARAWQLVAELDVQFIRLEMNPQFIQIATSSDLVAAITFDIEAGTLNTELVLCLPGNLLEPLRERLQQSHDAKENVVESWGGESFGREIKNVEVEIAVKLATVPHTLAQLIRLKVGDILPISLPDEVETTVEEWPYLKGKIGIHQGRYAVKVTRMLSEE